MFIKLTVEQEMLRTSIRSVAQKCGASGGEGATAPIDPAGASDQIALLGLGDILDTPLDGAWSGCVEAAVAASELARWLVPVPFLGTTVMADPLLRVTGSAPQGTVASAPDPTLRTLGVLVGATSATAWDAAGATSAVVLREDGDGWAVLSAPLDHDRHGLTPADLTRRACHAPLDGATQLGTLRGAEGRDFVTRLEALALACLAADVVGTMEGALAISRSYALSRRQFDKPIGSFQAVQHLLADQHIALQAARIAAYYASWSVEHRSPDEALQSARVAKAYASEVGITAGEAVIQVHGGIGFTWEHSAHLFLRRTVYDRVALGDEHLHYREYLAGLRRDAP